MVYLPKSIRDKVSQSARGHCEYCKMSEEFSGTPLEIDHVIPQSNEGETSEENLALSCRVCNSQKSSFQFAKDPETGEEMVLFNPRLDAWQEHFKWSDDGTNIIGLTAKARATISRLKMNNSLIVNARRIWLKANWTAPQS